jgi:hypothetical protein
MTSTHGLKESEARSNEVHPIGAAKTDFVYIVETAQGHSREHDFENCLVCRSVPVMCNSSQRCTGCVQLASSTCLSRRFDEYPQKREQRPYQGAKPDIGNIGNIATTYSRTIGERITAKSSSQRKRRRH